MGIAPTKTRPHARMRSAATTVALAAALGGCATVTYVPQGIQTAEQDCVGRATCTVKVDPLNGMVPDRILVTKAADTEIVWDLDTADRNKWWWGRGVSFDDPGNVIDCSLGIFRKRTCTKRAEKDDKEKDRDGDKGKYKYTIWLFDTTTGARIKHDPWVVNR